MSDNTTQKKRRRKKMSVNINKMEVMGCLGQDPVLRYTPNGQAVATLSLATNFVYTKSTGEKVKQTEWHRIVVWGKQAENCAKYLNKGRSVYVSGRLQTRKWTDKEGLLRYTTEIVAREVQFGSQTASQLAQQNMEVVQEMPIMEEEDQPLEQLNLLNHLQITL